MIVALMALNFRVFANSRYIVFLFIPNTGGTHVLYVTNEVTFKRIPINRQYLSIGMKNLRFATKLNCFPIVLRLTFDWRQPQTTFGLSLMTGTKIEYLLQIIRALANFEPWTCRRSYKWFMHYKQQSRAFNSNDMHTFSLKLRSIVFSFVYMVVFYSLLIFLRQHKSSR